MGTNLLNGFSPLYQISEFFFCFVLSVLGSIALFVSLVIIFLRLIGWTYRDLLENDKIESWWTYIPGIAISLICMPSFYGLYQGTTIAPLPKQTVKVTGHQWYWNYVESFYLYTYSNHVVRRCRGIVCSFKDLVLLRKRRDTVTEHTSCFYKTYDFNSHWVPDATGRNSNVDKPLILFLRVYTRFLVTASDVAHSFSIPQTGLKVDAIPGRLNQGFFYSTRVGKFVGQCSEVCGANHTYMPIVIECVDAQGFRGLVGKKHFDVTLDSPCNLHFVKHPAVLHTYSTTYEYLNN